MKSRATIFGHPIHVMLIPFPVGLLPISLLFDILYVVRNNPQFSIVAYWTLLVGIISALVAAVFGLIDWTKIPRDTRARGVGIRHALSNVVGVVFFVISLLMRIDRPESPETMAIILSAIGVVSMTVGAWLGGDLPYRLGMGIEEGANLNAPSPFSGRPPSDTAPRHPYPTI